MRFSMCGARFSFGVFLTKIFLVFLMPPSCSYFRNHVNDGRTTAPAAFVAALVRPMRPKEMASLRFRSAGNRGAMVLVDVENVRGKSGFELNHQDLIDATVLWGRKYGLQGKISLVVDHGSRPTAHWLDEEAIAVVFAGKHMKADDVIARDVAYCQRDLGRDVVVITADQELKQRCRRAASIFAEDTGQGRQLSILSPMHFLEEINQVIDEENSKQKKETEDMAEDITANDDDEVMSSEVANEINKELELKAQLAKIASALKYKGKNNRVSNKKKRKLQKQAQRILFRLGTSPPSKLSHVYSETSDEMNEIISKWDRFRFAFRRKEVTGDRVILAERLRRQLENITESSQAERNESMSNYLNMDPAKAHALYANRIMSGLNEPKETMPEVVRVVVPPPTTISSIDEDVELEKDEILRVETNSTKDVLRMVIVSDTHGFEETLTRNGNALQPWLLTQSDLEHQQQHRVSITGEEEMKMDDGQGITSATMTKPEFYHQGPGLPDGDVLLHLGDFAIDSGGRRKQDALHNFDQWLSKQPQPVKIVLRGNHDPFNVAFPLSGATYVTKPTTFLINNQVVATVPYQGYSSKRMYIKSPKKQRKELTKVSKRLLVPPSCDVLATHEPPKYILDECLSGDRAGSTTLRAAVETMAGRPPKLWVCGHIHESRGSQRVQLSPNESNGDATATTLVVNAANANPGRAQFLMHGPVVIDVPSSEDGATNIMDTLMPRGSDCIPSVIPGIAEPKEEGVGHLLMAIDLGLRCGGALYDDEGRLVRYEQFFFRDAADLFARAPVILKSWEDEVNLGQLQLEDACDNNDLPPKLWVLKYVAIEGVGDLWDAWSSAVDSLSSAVPSSFVQTNHLETNHQKKNDGRVTHLVGVSPNEWRSQLLSAKERVSGRSAKAAARFIAKQVVHDFHDGPNRVSRIKTDAAESVVMGLYMANRLGWVNREPLVKRYTNGYVVVPSGD